MKVKTSNLRGLALNFAVALANGEKPELNMVSHGRTWPGIWLTSGEYAPCPDYQGEWAAGGPIIEREGLSIRYAQKDARGAWYAVQGPNRFLSPDFEGSGPTPLIAAMRCYVASELGDEVEVPDGLV